MLHPRAAAILFLVGGAGYLALAALDAPGVAVVLALFLAAMPLTLRPLAAPLRAEWAGALFVFLVACYAEVLDDVFHAPQRFSTAILLLGAIYVFARRDTALAIARTPIGALLALFLLQQVVSAYALGAPDALRTLENRISIYVSFLAAATLVRRPGGAQLMPAVVVLAVLASLPVMLRELTTPDLLQSLVAGDEPTTNEAVQSGGLYTQANNAGIALTYALAFALGLETRRAQRIAFAAAIAVGVVCTASRGAFMILLVLVVGAGLVARLRTQSRAAFAATIVATFSGLLFLRPLARFLVHLTDGAKESVPSIARLQEVLLALAGSTETLADDDSRRSGIAAAAWQMIGERPLFGRGTGNFIIADAHGDLRSHVQFLEVLGENGAVGGVLYAALLVAVAFAIRRAPPSLRLAVGVVCAAWLLTHFDNHNLMEYRFMILPIAFACGVAR